MQIQCSNGCANCDKPQHLGQCERSPDLRLCICGHVREEHAPDGRICGGYFDRFDPTIGHYQTDCECKEFVEATKT